MAIKGDKAAGESWKEFGKHLGIMLSYVVNVVDPEIIVVGGSLGKSYDLFRDEMDSTVRKNVTGVPRKKLKIDVARLGDSAGVTGAACLFLGKLI